MMPKRNNNGSMSRRTKSSVRSLNHIHMSQREEFQLRVTWNKTNATRTTSQRLTKKKKTTTKMESHTSLVVLCAECIFLYIFNFYLKFDPLATGSVNGSHYFGFSIHYSTERWPLNSLRFFFSTFFHYTYFAHRLF